MFWLQQIKQWLIRTVRGLSCLNSPVPFLLTQVCAQHVSGRTPNCFFLVDARAPRCGELRQVVGTHNFGNSSFAPLAEEAWRSTCLRPPYKQIIPSCVQKVRPTFWVLTQNQSLPFQKVSHIKKYSFKISFYLPCLHCSFISLANWLQLPHIEMQIFSLTCMVCCS